jgi:hypothetical protein
MEVLSSTPISSLRRPCNARETSMGDWNESQTKLLCNCRLDKPICPKATKSGPSNSPQALGPLPCPSSRSIIIGQGKFTPRIDTLIRPDTLPLLCAAWRAVEGVLDSHGRIFDKLSGEPAHRLAARRTSGSFEPLDRFSYFFHHRGTLDHARGSRKPPNAACL